MGQENETTAVFLTEAVNVRIRLVGDFKEMRVEIVAAILGDADGHNVGMV